MDSDFIQCDRYIRFDGEGKDTILLLFNTFNNLLANNVQTSARASQLPMTRQSMGLCEQVVEMYVRPSSTPPVTTMGLTMKPYHYCRQIDEFIGINRGQGRLYNIIIRRHNRLDFW